MANPTAQWTAQQIVEAFPFDTAQRDLLRHRDRIYGDTVVELHQILSLFPRTFAFQIDPPGEQNLAVGQIGMPVSAG